MPQPITLTPRILALLGGVFIAICALLILGGAAALHWRASDERAFNDLDRRMILATSAQCDRRARLLHDPLRGGFSCVYINPDGEAMLQPVLEFPLELNRGM